MDNRILGRSGLEVSAMEKPGAMRFGPLPGEQMEKIAALLA